jgi:hypothetical protein
MKSVLALVAMTLLTVSSFAYSVPASTYSVRDLRAIFNDSKIAVMVGYDAIQKVTAIAPMTYLIQSKSCSVEVKLKDNAKSVPGFIGNGLYSPVVESYQNSVCNN